MIDTFQASNEGWFAGGGPMGVVPPDPPHVVSTGGPTGANDAFLQVAASGTAGPGGRLVAMNTSQWTGDFTAIPTIEMDVINLGATDLMLRLLFENPTVGPPLDMAITDGVALLSGSGWTHIVFAIDAGSLTALLGSAADLMTNVTVMRLLHGDLATFPPDPIAAILGVDNISAGFVPRPGPFGPGPDVPEPATLLLLGSAIAAAAMRRRRPRA